MLLLEKTNLCRGCKEPMWPCRVCVFTTLLPSMNCTTTNCEYFSKNCYFCNEAPDANAT